jgi:hypothetical protein
MLVGWAMWLVETTWLEVGWESKVCLCCRVTCYGNIFIYGTGPAAPMRLDILSLNLLCALSRYISTISDHP